VSSDHNLSATRDDNSLHRCGSCVDGWCARCPGTATTPGTCG